MNAELIEAVILTIMTAATPLLLAALGELVVERSGVLNLGVEGLMIVGAVTGFAAAQLTGNAWAGVFFAPICGALFSLLFAFLTVTLATNQVATGLSLTLLGLGIAGMAGEAFIGLPGIRLETLSLPVLSDIPVVGQILFGQDPIFYISIILLLAIRWFIFSTRGGLTLRSVGDNHVSAHALGINVARVRYLAIMFGGSCAGLAGAHLSLVYTPQWTETMTAGRGWIALALVVFASWLPGRVLIGAYLFGGVTILQFHAQAQGVGIPSQFLSALPYVATIVVLVLISANRRMTMKNTPAMLGRPFVPDT
ncbi:MAG: ABC transporter permease [Pseudomonadota bacterium]